MKEMKRILALVLCFVMLVGMMPAVALNAEAAERTLLDAAVFCSDVHGNPSTVTSVFNGIKSMDSTFNPSTASFVGDTQCASSSVTAAAQQVYPNVQCIYAYGNHDSEGNYGIADFTGLSYSGENYYIYSISESSMGSSNPDTTGFTSTVAGLDQTKPLFILSHLPLHERRGDSNGAPAWYAAISAAAEEMDIFFFWAHNHTSEKDVDRAAYYVPNDGSESILIEYGDGEPVYPKFTYANAGYIDPPNTPARNNVATAVYIYDNSVDLVVCNEDGALSGSYAVDVSVNRDHAASEPVATTPVVDRIEAVSNKDVYYLGEELDLTVYEVYTNGDKVEIEGYTVSDYDSSALGVQTVFVTYGDYSTTVSVTVVEQDAEPVITGLQVTYSKETLLGGTLTLKVVAEYDNGTTVELAEGEYTVSGYVPNTTGAQTVLVSYETAGYAFTIANNTDVTVVADGMASLTVTDVTETLTETLADKLETGFVAYDIVPNAYSVEENIAVVSMPAPEGADAVYYWNEETGELEPLSDFTFENGKVVFTTNHFSTYVVGRSTEITIPEGETATGSGEVTITTPKTVYVLTSGNPSGEVLIANSNSASSTTRYLLARNGSSVAATAVTIKSGDVDGDGTTDTYIELDDAADELWTVDGSYTFQNGGYYLRYNSGLGLSTSSSTTWAYSSNRLRYRASNYSSYNYLRYNNGWTTTTSSNYATSIYFYVPTEIEVETTTTVSGTYSIAAENVSVVVNPEATEEQTADLTAILTLTPDNGGTPTTTDVSLNATYEVVSDENGIIDGEIVEGVAVLTGNYGTALVKISYEVSFGEEKKTVTNYVTVTASEPYYTLEIEQGESYVHKGVQAGQTLDLNATVKMFDGTNDEGNTVTNPTLVWTIESGSGATIDENTGVLTFDGSEGEVKVKVIHKVDENTTLEDYITVHIHKSTAITPEESTTDFPRWPNPGAVRFDKTAQAVGNFSNTGVAQMELSMAGIPFGSASGFDVIVPIDWTSSMDEQVGSSSSYQRYHAAVDALQAFLVAIMIDENDQFTGNRVLLYIFQNTNVLHVKLNSDTATNAFETITAETIASASGSTNKEKLTNWLESAITVSKLDTQLTNKTNKVSVTLDTGYTSSEDSAGNTFYSYPLKAMYDKYTSTAYQTDGAGRGRYCVFMTDGGPSGYYYGVNSYSQNADGSYTYNYSNYGSSTIGDWVSTSSPYTTSAKPELYSLKARLEASVTVYGVGLGVDTAGNPYNDYADARYEALVNGIMNQIVTPSDGETQTYYPVTDSAAGDGGLSDAFENIATSIKAAATNIEVADKITDSYEMIFKWPKAVKTEDQVANQEFYIEVVNYDLNATTHERTGTYDVLTRIYLTEGTDGNLSISKLVKIDNVTATSSGTETTLTTNPVYTAVGEDEKGFFNLVEDEYVYVADGTGAYKMTAGATVTGTADTVELHTPYFSYDAATKVIKWHVSETTENAEIALRYFLYLTNSLESAAGDIEEFLEDGVTPNPDYVSAGTYPTNDYATLGYINYRGNEVMQYFPEPQLTWNGAQVSYVFYLVNEAGQPVNRAGRVVTFAESVFVTKVYTESVVWNDDEGISELNAIRIADDLLPDDYQLYDENTEYEIHVYQNENGEDIYNYFTITGGNGTTVVYNTKAGTKYSTAGQYTSLMEEMDGFDFANTTVAFAVVWEQKLVEDTVVVDYGLPVDINVTTNDFVYNAITAIGTETPSTTINTGLYDNSTLSVKVDETTHMSGVLSVGEHSAQVINENVIRFTPGSMEFNAPVTFNYETMTDYYVNSAVEQAYMYSSVTVIPATTIYYEDEFVDLKTYTNPVTVENEDGTTTTTYTESKGWTTAGTTANATQAQDRPGESQITDTLDADNNYGYDAAYSAMSTYSLGSAAMVNVTTGKYATATFTFYGTGFDVISMTSNTTGTLTVKIVDANGAAVKNMVVDTYYGYTRNEDGEWVATPDTANALYQVPVIKAEGLTYGKYTVTITASYVKLFDHTTPAGYDLYLDAIRIYDPANDGANNKVVEDAYKADGEGWPSYIELRNKLIDAGTFNQATNAVTGEVFIDGDATVGNAQIDDYTSYGPNNELYLAKGQSIAFQLGNLNKVAKIQLGIKSADGNAVTYTIKNITAQGTESNAKTATISTATDMYYDITGWKDGIIVITNSGNSGIISLTNIKATYTENPNSTVVTSEEGTDDVASETNEVYTYMTPAAATLTLRALNRPAVVEPEETEPETTEPETTEPETTEPETTEPETTEPETTEPEVTEPEETPTVSQVVKEIVKGIVNVLGKLFSRWF